MEFTSRNQTLDTNPEPGSDLEEEDLEKLESDVKQIAQKIAEYRKTLPDELRNTLASVLSPNTPVLADIELGSDPGRPRRTISESEEPIVSSTVSQLANEERQSSEKMTQLKERISRNISAVPAVVKRMQECIDRIDKLDSLNGTIHPAFRRRRTT